MKCEDCKWFHGDINGGACRRHAPIPISDQKHYIYFAENGGPDYSGPVRNPYPMEIVAAWPRVETFDWCGDFGIKTAENVDP